MQKIIIIRPGALGDVLAVRGVIRFFKEIFPGSEVNLIAPGARGLFFEQNGWADNVYDWDRALFSWLFSVNGQLPSPTLTAIFSQCNLLFAFVDDVNSTMDTRLEQLAPFAYRAYCSSQPPSGYDKSIGYWLLESAMSFCMYWGLVDQDLKIDRNDFAAARFIVAGGQDFLMPLDRRYVVLHPGSGSVRKNWPLDNFAALGAMLVSETNLDGSTLFTHVFIVSGEADGNLGERLAEVIPSAMHLHEMDLPLLATVLAHAYLYIGNDSGVSHLAGAVKTVSGQRPRCAVIFGPSDPVVWLPSGALMLRAGKGMDMLTPIAALTAIREKFYR